jgi:hypothetical protein
MSQLSYERGIVLVLAAMWGAGCTSLDFHGRELG